MLLFRHGCTYELLEEVRPLLQKYNVDAYLSGHDHSLQHLAQNGVNYFVTGAGAISESVTKIDQSIWAAPTAGFTLHTVDSSTMKVQFMSHDGHILHTHDMKKADKHVPSDQRPCNDKYEYTCQRKWCSALYWQQQCQKTCLICDPALDLVGKASPNAAPATCEDTYAYECKESWCGSEYWDNQCQRTCGICTHKPVDLAAKTQQLRVSETIVTNDNIRLDEDDTDDEDESSDDDESSDESEDEDRWLSSGDDKKREFAEQSEEGEQGCVDSYAWGKCVWSWCSSTYWRKQCRKTCEQC